MQTKKTNPQLSSRLFLVLFITSALIFSSCGGDDEAESSDNENTETAGSQTNYETPDFTITAPSDWEIIEKDSFTGNVPQDTVVGFRNNIRSEVFTANINISKSELEKETSLEDFAKSSLKKAKNSVIDFTELRGESYELANEESAYLLEFEGRKSASEVKVKFRQLYIISGSTGYIVTAAYLTNEEESVVNSVDEMLNSFALK